MKLKFKKKIRREEDEGSSGKSSRPAWMMASEEQQNQAMREAKMMQNKNRPPEFWLMDGDEKPIRIRHEGAIACLWRYTVNMGGNKYQQYTMPDDGEVDLFRDELGLTAQVRAIYEIIDIKGYTDKLEKRHRYMPRFLNCNGKMHEQLQTVKRKRGPLNTYNIDMSRSGSRQQTTYVFMPDSPSPMTEEMRKPESLKAKFLQYYAPPSESEQRSIVNKASRIGGQVISSSRRRNDDDEDDD